MTQKTARLHIQRGAPGTAPRTAIFEVPFEPGNSVLDGLRWIRATLDPTLAIRFSCINANACKECMLELEGEVVYACTQRLREGDMHLAPLANKALVQDLVTEIAPRDERLLR
ncbi:MAG: 2Fe-2S iron-sulfur cluster-binding protein [Giesbergeria sp.]